MTDQDKKPGPIHADFARDLVAVCRKHHMCHLDAKYRAGFKSGAEDDFSGYVTINWSEGRHGDLSRINIRFEGTSSFPEVKGSTL